MPMDHHCAESDRKIGSIMRPISPSNVYKLPLMFPIRFGCLLGRFGTAFSWKEASEEKRWRSEWWCGAWLIPRARRFSIVAKRSRFGCEFWMCTILGVVIYVFFAMKGCLDINGCIVVKIYIRNAKWIQTIEIRYCLENITVPLYKYCGLFSNALLLYDRSHRYIFL